MDLDLDNSAGTAGSADPVTLSLRCHVVPISGCRGTKGIGPISITSLSQSSAHGVSTYQAVRIRRQVLIWL
ncbi:MAG: hypothetical protein ACLQO6_11995 [Desulfomonilaceae bacterium]